MRIIEPGHVYEVENVDGDGVQRIEFVRRRGDDAELLPERLRREGILSQELLRVLIDRTLYLGAEAAWHENIEILTSLRKALQVYEARAAAATIYKTPMPERMPGCPICGHVLCLHHRGNG